MSLSINKSFRFTLVLIAFTSISILTSCKTSQSVSQIADQEARNIIKQSIKYHGGMKIYDDLNYFSFEKAFSLYESDGSVEYQRIQFHDYYPSKSTYHIRWKQEGKCGK